MEYKLMEPPFDVIPFQDMNKKQAEQFFNWFMSEKENRIRQLQAYINESDPSIVLDKTPDSLLELWEWFEPNIEWKEIEEEELKRRLIGKPEWIKQIIMEEKYEQTTLTKAISVDIATYFGDTLIENNPEVKWCYRRRPKTLDGVNQPILEGFYTGVSANPRTLVEVCIFKSRDEKCMGRLLDLYGIWVWCP